MNKQPVIRKVIHTVLLIVLLAGCAPAAQDAGRQQTLDAMAVRVGLTATAAASEEGDEGGGEATAVTRATQVVVEQQATATLRATQDLAAAKATAEVERPVIAEVRFFDVDPEKGRVGWVHPPVTLEVQGQNGFKAVNDFGEVIAKDFVMSADITWNTQYGDSGCGFVVRSDGNPNVPNMYLIGMTRFANGHAEMLVMADGEVVNGHDLYPRTKDRKFSSENDTTNQLTVVGRGNKFQIYTNGRLIGEVDPTQPPALPAIPPAPEATAGANDPAFKATYSALQQEQQQVTSEMRARLEERQEMFQESDKEFPEGFTALVAITQGGKATCKFENAWLWLIEE